MTFKVLFFTPEFEDYVRVGGLASVALRRAMKSRVNVRLLLPRYRGVLVGGSPMLGEMPACSIGRTAKYDGLQVYVAICPELYDRDGTPYADEVGRECATPTSVSTGGGVSGGRPGRSGLAR